MSPSDELHGAGKFSRKTKAIGRKNKGLNDNAERQEVFRAKENERLSLPWCFFGADDKANIQPFDVKN